MDIADIENAIKENADVVMAFMKHVGLNVASDPFMSIAYTGVRGGKIVVGPASTPFQCPVAPGEFMFGLD